MTRISGNLLSIINKLRTFFDAEFLLLRYYANRPYVTFAYVACTVPDIMNEKNILAAQLLTYTGIIPFLFLGMAVALHASGLDYRLALFSYGAVIISFLCGIHWAAFLFFSQHFSRNLLFHSNAISLLGWLSVLPVMSYLTFALQIVCFLYLVILDLELYRNNVIPLWFFHVRLNATIVVIVLLFITACYS